MTTLDELRKHTKWIRKLFNFWFGHEHERCPRGCGRCHGCGKLLWPHDMDELRKQEEMR